MPPLPLRGRCCRRIIDLMGISDLDFLRAFDRANLLDRWPGRAGKGDSFPMDDAIDGAVALRELIFARRYAWVLMLGGGVVAAFHGDSRAVAPLAWVRDGAFDGGWTRWGHLPHPSGINRWWNASDNLEAGRILLVMLAAVAMEAASRPPAR